MSVVSISGSASRSVLLTTQCEKCIFQRFIVDSKTLTYHFGLSIIFGFVFNNYYKIYSMKKFLLALTILITSFVYAQNPIQYLLVGTYTNTGKSEGIYVYRFNPNRNEATQVSVTK